MTHPRGRAGILVRATIKPEDGTPVFETIAFLSTVGFAIIFVVLFQIDRSSRQSEEKGAE